ncbi:MAG TPA: NAD(P)/FAD-dependent oxidoreductase [Thermoanaerobaculia bacterium]|nr:NAD(P)/FAD-dependent oxidoreductase [Thermoanaerobaculia bacterium]
MTLETPRRAIIIGAGPAGLTAAYQLLVETDVQPLVLERSALMGGISRTVEHHGNRIDIGGHRFFSKSDRVMDWWTSMLPIEQGAGNDVAITYHNRSAMLEGEFPRADPEQTDEVLLVRPRKSRIFYRGTFFDYPISLSPRTLVNLGPWTSLKIGLSYLRSAVLPKRDPQNLEEFLVGRFGRELYLTFFKDYTEKVWGVRCTEISAEWGAQRIKGLSIAKAILHFVKSVLPKRANTDLKQKGAETSLIERFLYPKLGPGQMWDVVRRKVEAMGGEVVTHREVTGLVTDGNLVLAVEARDPHTGETFTYEGDFFFSTMAVTDLVHALDRKPPEEVVEVADGLLYRDFITVGLLVDRLKIEHRPGSGRVADTWIYIQEPGVQIGRLQIFNNWSPYMVADPHHTVWLGLEYFCYDTDELWRMSDDELRELGERELVEIGVLHPDSVRDGVVLRMPKTYPAYFGTYDRFPVVRDYLDRFENLFLVGRNGMHKYNNQDHSMLTAMIAVENIRDGVTDKSNLWEVNTEDEYHEEK